MKRKEFKETLFETLNNVVDGMSYGPMSRFSTG